MRVEIEVFSGRPNPEFPLSGDEARHLLSLLDGLPSAAAPTGEEALGYHGMKVTVSGGPAGTPKSVRASSGVITVDGARHYQDTHGIEKWLLDRAAEKGHRELVDPLR